MRSRLPIATLAGAVVLVLTAVAVGTWIGRGPASDVGGASPSPSGTTAAAASPIVPSDSPGPSPSSGATTLPSPTVDANDTACATADLAGRIVRWEGAAGSRIATIELTNTGTYACLLDAMARPQLVDRANTVLLNGKSPTSTDTLTLAPGDVVTTLVSASNYCQAPPRPPVSVAFILSNGERILAHPDNLDDATVPDCLGPGQPGQIEMHPWS